MARGVPLPHSQAGPDTPARWPGAVFAELHTGDWRGAGQRRHLLHLPAQGSGAPRRQQGPALARGECGWGVSVPRTPTRPGMQGPPWPLHWAPSQGFPAWGAPSPAPKGIWALSPPLLSSPALGQVHSSLFTYLYEHQKKTLSYYFHFMLGWDYLCILPQYFLF